MKSKNNNDSNTFLGKDSLFEGDMKFYGTIRIEGLFKGNVLGDGTVIVGRNAELMSNIHASDVINYGTIHGQISANHKIYVYASGVISGDIEAPAIQIEKGACIKGKCNTRKVCHPNHPDLPSDDHNSILN